MYTCTGGGFCCCFCLFLNNFFCSSYFYNGTRKNSTFFNKSAEPPLGALGSCCMLKLMGSFVAPWDDNSMSNAHCSVCRTTIFDKCSAKFQTLLARCSVKKNAEEGRDIQKKLKFYIHGTGWEYMYICKTTLQMIFKKTKKNIQEKKKKLTHLQHTKSGLLVSFQFSICALKTFQASQRSAMQQFSSMVYLDHLILIDDQE